MAEAKKDDNNINTMTGVLNTDGNTPTLLKIDPSTHILDTANGSSGSDFGRSNATRDENYVPVLMAVSSSDGATPVPIYINSSGNLLIKST